MSTSPSDSVADEPIPEFRDLLPEVDVVVVAFNGGAALFDVVNRLLSSEAIVVRLFVVDNASTDGSAETLKELPVEVVALERNVGYGAGFNAGFARTRARWVVCANQDATVRPDTLRRLVDAAAGSFGGDDKHPVIAAPLILRPDSSVVETCHGLPTLLAQCRALMFGERFGTRNVVPPSHQGRLLCGWVSAVCILGSRDTFELLNGFDETYFMYVEDLDLFFRLRAIGGVCIWEPRAVVTHSGGVDPTTRGAVSPQLYGLTLWNLRYYFEKRARRVPCCQGAVILAAGCLGSTSRALLWSVRWVVTLRQDGRGGSRRELEMARMFAGGARTSAWALVTGHLPDDVSRKTSGGRANPGGSEPAGPASG